MKIGVDYYPEQWDETLWEKDADLMAKTGVKIVRMAEFAWSRLEPKEGQYSFEWLDRVIELFAQRKIQVFLCTPTCTPPLWLYEKYPEVIQVDKNGQRIPIGIRGHRCLNQPLYREKCSRIITEMVTRYKDNPWVIGYQIDNELEANHCCCTVCQEKFRNFIKKKYKTIERVNKAYGNSVWSGEYSDFSQITPPYGPFQTWLNPSYMLDFNRYASESTVDYVRFQWEIIRKTDPKAKITTNNWLCENMPDFYKLFENLDFVSYDNYPTTVIPKNTQEIYSHGFHLDLMRGIKQQNFWIMEQLSGGLGSWTPMSPTLQPGMLEGYSMQAIAHGADTVVHFRWRTGRSGAEMFWHGIIDHNNVPGRRFQEFARLCKRVEKLSCLDGSTIKNKVAILYSSEQEYAFKIQPQVEGMHYFTQLKAYHDGFTGMGVGVDIVDWLSDLRDYSIVVAPTLFVTNPDIEKNLKTYVKQGGTLLLTNRSGVKDENNCCIMEPLPTVFREMTESVVEEYDPVGANEQSLVVVDEKWKKILKDYKMEQGIPCHLWCDIIEEKNAKVLARYNSNFYKGKAAITENTYGKGKAYYVGTCLERDGLRTLLHSILFSTKVEYTIGLPKGIERTVREKGKTKWNFWFNNTDKRQEFAYEIRNGSSKVEGKKKLQPFEMVIEDLEV